MILPQLLQLLLNPAYLARHTLLEAMPEELSASFPFDIRAPSTTSAQNVMERKLGVLPLIPLILTKYGDIVQVWTLSIWFYLSKQFSFSCFHPNSANVHSKNVVFISHSDTTCNAPSTPCETYTVGGSGNGASCVFPFNYKQALYYQCISKNNKGRPWCATSYNYDTEKRWGNCAGKHD